MSPDDFLQPNVPKATQDARDLIARLYREIGLSAVAAALQLPLKKEPVVSAFRAGMPAILRSEDKAA
jgi:hypothetical protein